MNNYTYQYTTIYFLIEKEGGFFGFGASTNFVANIFNEKFYLSELDSILDWYSSKGWELFSVNSIIGGNIQSASLIPNANTAVGFSETTGFKYIFRKITEENLIANDITSKLDTALTKYNNKQIIKQQEEEKKEKENHKKLNEAENFKASIRIQLVNKFKKMDDFQFEIIESEKYLLVASYQIKVESGMFSKKYEIKKRLFCLELKEKIDEEFFKVSIVDSNTNTVTYDFNLSFEEMEEYLKTKKLY